MDTFIFNLNKNQKYKKLKADYSIYCNSLFIPYTEDFGYDINIISIKPIVYYINYINEYYDKGSEIFPSNNQEKIYDLMKLKFIK